MTEEEYRKMVIEMRARQDAWFRHHQQSDLIEAKRLEKLIDIENRRYQARQESNKSVADAQTALFEPENEQKEWTDE